MRRARKVTLRTLEALAVLLLLAGPASTALAAVRPGAAEPDEQTPAASGRRAADVPIYDPTGKRDPFQPVTREGAPSVGMGLARTPLQQFELSQLRLVAIINDPVNPAEARAVVEDSAGLGYIMRVGTPIGRNDGRVTAIEGAQIVIEEWPVNVFGERRRAVIVKELDAGEEAKR